MANIVIDIAAEFTGKNAFKSAETSTDKLLKGVKKLAGATGLAFGTAQVIAFGKASVKAALDAQAQQERLANLVKVTVGASESQIRSLNEQAAALENIGVVNKENVTQTQSQLATFNFQIDTIKQLTPAILDYVTAEKGAAASTDEFRSMTNGLAQALNGNFASLTKSGFVLDDATKKIIKNGTETERTAAIVAVLDSTYKDFNKNLRMTDSGQMQVLANVADDVKETIGTGLIDAFKILAGDGGIQGATDAMKEFGETAAEILVGTASYVDKLIEAFNGTGTGSGPKLGNFSALLLPFLGQGGILDILKTEGAKINAQGQSSAAGLAHLAELEAKYTIKTLNAKKKLTTEELKALNAAKLKLAINKANLALGKGGDVFDMEKISLAAAEKNAAEQLGKVTSQAQLLQITNDLARIKLKESILALEDAIASKDVAAITAATNKLNADLQIVGALTGQELKLRDIEKILKDLLPKDLINLANLNEAIRLLGLIGAGTGTGTGTVTKNATPILGDPNASPVGIPTATTAADINAALIAGSFVGSGGSGGSANAGAYASSGFPGATKNGGVTVVVNAGTIANPEELTTMIQNAVISLNKRGDLLTTAGSL